MRREAQKESVDSIPFSLSALERLYSTQVDSRNSLALPAFSTLHRDIYRYKVLHLTWTIKEQRVPLT